MSNEALYNLYEKGLLSDVTLNVRGKKFNVHKIILAAGSEYFETLFLSSFREAQQREFSVDDDPNLFDSLIAWIYKVPTSNFNVAHDISLTKLMTKYRVRDFNPDFFLADSPITKEDFDEYINFIAETYPNGIPDPIIDNIRLALNQGDYDLEKLSDDVILKLFTIPGFIPGNLAEFQSDLVKAVTDGKSPQILSLINYDFLPAGTAPGLSGAGPIPNLSKDLYGLVTYGRDRDNWLMVISEPREYGDTEGTNYLTMKVIDGDSRIWQAVSNGEDLPLQPPRIYDIITLDITGIGRPYLPKEVVIINFNDWVLAGHVLE